MIETCYLYEEDVKDNVDDDGDDDGDDDCDDDGDYGDGDEDMNNKDTSR